MNHRDDWDDPGLWGEGEQERTDWVTRTPGSTERMPEQREPLQKPLPASLAQEPAPLDLSDERTDKIQPMPTPVSTPLAGAPTKKNAPPRRPAPVPAPRPPPRAPAPVKAASPAPRRSGKRARQQRMALVGVGAGVFATFCLGAVLLLGVAVYSQQRASQNAVGLVATAPTAAGTPSGGLVASGTAAGTAPALVEPVVEEVAAAPPPPVAPRPTPRAAPTRRPTPAPTAPPVAAAAPRPAPAPAPAPALPPEPQPEPAQPVAKAPAIEAPMVPTEPAWDGLSGDFVDGDSTYDLLADEDDGMDGLAATLTTDDGEGDAWLDDADSDDPALAMLAEIDAPVAVTTVSVRIELDASGVPVAVDGRSVGAAPLSLNLSPGWHAIVLGTGENAAKFRMEAGSSGVSWCFESKGKSYRETTCGG